MKPGGQIERMLTHYDALLAVLSRCRGAAMQELLQALQSSRAQIDGIRTQTPKKVKSVQIRHGLRQGLREIPLIITPMLAAEAEQERSDLLAVLSRIEAEYGKAPSS